MRSYTDFAERHGDANAAALLRRYRALVRTAIEQFQGAEIRTEGDSFYVVFDSVGDAVRCGLEITRRAAADPQEHADGRISVGVGINAGETVDTAEGYVGSSVNIAARICALARPGEVLVSDTVRALTRTLLPVHFESRGRRQLKGVADPMVIYAVTEAAPGAGALSLPRSLSDRVAGRKFLLLAAVLGLLGVGVVAWALWPRGVAGLPPGPWHIGLDMPLTGDAAFRGVPVRNAVTLAMAAVNSDGGVDGAQLVLDEYDDAGPRPDGQDPERGANNARAMVAEDRTIAMIGPWGSAVGYATIPITNSAGLLQCSPANTGPELTKPRFGANELRDENRINYVRLPPSDDIQGWALASYAFHDLRLRSLLVVDDTDVGEDVAEGFRQAFERLGGQTMRFALGPGTDPETVLAPLAAGSGAPTGVFFGGFTDTGAADLRLAMVAAGHQSVPFLSWDGIFDGSGADEGSYIERTGDTAVGSYLAHASLPPAERTLVDDYREAYGAEPDEYAAAGYACVEIIAQALAGVAEAGSSAEGLREALRAYAVDERHDYDTVLGEIRFDENGDSTRQYVTFYRVEASAAGGAGDWVSAKQEYFEPVP